MYLAPEHRKLAAKLGDTLLAIEHFRQPVRTFTTDVLTLSSPTAVYDHYAVVVQKSGYCFAGEAVCSTKDQYSHKRGYAISVGRALRRTVHNNQSFVVPETLRGRELRDYIRTILFGTSDEIRKAIGPLESSDHPDDVRFSETVGQATRQESNDPPSLREEKLGGGQPKNIEAVVEHYTLPADIYHFRCPNCGTDHPKSDLGGICKSSDRILMYSWSTFAASELKSMLQKWRDAESEAHIRADLIEEILTYNE